MLTFFYSPNCFFSAKVARSLQQTAVFFPQLKIVAVDVSTMSSTGSDGLISQFGITSTPTIALWENGYPRYRLFDDFSEKDTLITAITTRTDLKANRTTSISEETAAEEFDEFLGQFAFSAESNAGYDFYLLLASATLLVNCLYFALFSPSAPIRFQRALKDLVANLIN